MLIVRPWENNKQYSAEKNEEKVYEFDKKKKNVHNTCASTKRGFQRFTYYNIYIKKKLMARFWEETN